MKVLPSILLCTVGVSLFYSNLRNLPKPEGYEQWLSDQEDANLLSLEFVERLKTAYSQKETSAIASSLGQLSPSNRLCGAEINSVADLIRLEYCAANARIVLLYSATTDGKAIADILTAYFEERGHQTEAIKIEQLQDDDPKAFRTKGLRNLVKAIGQQYRAYGGVALAMNATGGYKAQIAIAVLMGQALGIPVYYKHERFSEIISFPPMPIALDFKLWLEQNHWFKLLEDPNQVLSWTELELGELIGEWDERLEALIERVPVDETEVLLELSTVGQIFHERFQHEFSLQKTALLPPAVKTEQKKDASLTTHSWGGAKNRILGFMQKLIDEVEYVITCRTHYWNKDLRQPIHFRLTGGEVEGILSDGSWTVKFVVETSATSMEEKNVAIADLNERLT